MSQHQKINAAIAAEAQKLQSSGKFHKRFYNSKFYDVEVTAITQGVGGHPIMDGVDIEAFCVASTRQSSELSPEERTKKGLKPLIRTMLTEQHFNVFDAAAITFQATSTATVFDHFIRHTSIASAYCPKPQRNSRRYNPKDVVIAETELRHKAKGGNRQGSGEVISPDTEIGAQYYDILAAQNAQILERFNMLIDADVAPESARAILPNGTTLTNYTLTASVRTWLTVLSERLHHHAQKETRYLAHLIKAAFIQLCPIISEYFYNFEFAEQIKLTDWIAIEQMKKTYPQFIQYDSLIAHLRNTNKE